jgi:hypothetical protein
VVTVASCRYTLFFDPKNELGCPGDGLLEVPGVVKMTGKYVAVVKRGSCTFVAKLQLAYESGASSSHPLVLPILVIAACKIACGTSRTSCAAYVAG